MEGIHETDKVNLFWDVQLMRYHGGSFNLKTIGLVNIRLSCSCSSDLSGMGHCNHLARWGAIYLAVSELPPFLSSSFLLNSVPTWKSIQKFSYKVGFSVYKILRLVGSSVGHFSKSFINSLMCHPYDLTGRRLLSINLSLILEELSVDNCRELYISQVVFGGLLLACIQSILMLRGKFLTTISHWQLFDLYASKYTLFISKTAASHMRW